MATIYKRSKRKNEPYTIQYVDHLGKRRTRKGFTDKGLTEELAGKLESEARLRISGMIDPMQDRIAEQGRVGVEDHLTAFEESLSDNTPKHVKLTMSRVRRIMEGCEFASLACIDGEAVQAFLKTLRKTENIGHRTYNHYLQSVHAFCNWCVKTKRLLGNPVVGVERLNTAVDVRHARRSLTAEEVHLLVNSARDSRKRIQGFSGEQRARIYLLSYMTGLRRKEIASLTPRSFSLDVPTPTVTVDATCSKHRKKDVLPLHPELVGMLRQWLKGRRPTDRLFPDLEKKKTWLMVKKDLERIGIDYESPEGFADFHAAGRHSHITELLRNGTSLPEAKELARHSDINMTMRYTHIGLDDQARAIAKLPAPRKRAEPASHAAPEIDPALQMRCIFCGSGSHAVSFDGTDGEVQKRVNPCGCKGFDASSHSLATSGKVEAAGIEPAHEFPNVLPDKGLQKPPTSHTVHWQDPVGLRCRCVTSLGEDASFEHITAAWPHLPPHIREAIQTLVDAALLKHSADGGRP